MIVPVWQRFVEEKGISHEKERKKNTGVTQEYSDKENKFDKRELHKEKQTTKEQNKHA
jgi:hypothetical protein